MRGGLTTVRPLLFLLLFCCCCLPLDRSDFSEHSPLTISQCLVHLCLGDSICSSLGRASTLFDPLLLVTISVSERVCCFSLYGFFLRTVKLNFSCSGFSVVWWCAVFCCCDRSPGLIVVSRLYCVNCFTFSSKVFFEIFIVLIGVMYYWWLLL